MPNLTSPDFCTPWETHASRRDGGRWNIEKLVLWNPYVHIYTDQIPVYPCLTLSFSRMTYRRDYLDVDLSLRFEPITHQEYIQNIYTYIYIHAHGFPLFSTVLSSVYQRAHRSSLRSRFFIGIPGTKKKNIVRRDWKAIPSSGNEPLSLLSTSLSQLVFHAPGSSCITRQSIWIRGILPSDIAFLLEGGGNQSSGFLIWEFLGVKGRERCLSLESFEFTQLKNWVAKFNSWN